MAASRAWYGVADRPHVPPPDDPALGAFKEWWHFNFIDEASGVDGIVNLNLAGDPHRPGGGDAGLILLVHRPGKGWQGGLDLFDGVAARIGRDDVDIMLGQSRIRYDGASYLLDLERGAVRAELRFEPRTEPLMAWKNTPLGSGHINWLILPHLAVSGTLRFGDHSVTLDGARGYHDHNWGSWRWGEDFSWDWGFCAAAAEIDGAALSIVYDRTADRSGALAIEHSLGLWRGTRLARLFTRRTISARRSGRFEGAVRRLPGGVSLVDPSRVTGVPALVEISAREGSDRIELRYEPDAAIQIAIPRETGPGLAEINETMGWLSAEGQVAGLEIAFRRRACFEFVA